MWHFDNHSIGSQAYYLLILYKVSDSGFPLSVTESRPGICLDRVRFVSNALLGFNKHLSKYNELGIPFSWKKVLHIRLSLFVFYLMVYNHMRLLFQNIRNVNVFCIVIVTSTSVTNLKLKWGSSWINFSW